MAQNIQKVVLLACGSFNPITNMHLRMFELARDSLQRSGRYKVLAGVVSPVNDGYKKEHLLPAKHRCAMINLSLKNSDWIRMDTWEVEQGGWVRTAQVLKHLRELLDTRQNANKARSNLLANINEGTVGLKLLCGADLLESFGQQGLWKDEDIEEIVSKYGVVCINRAGSNPERFIYGSDLLYKNQHNIHIVTEWITNDISATKIRTALRRGESIKYLVHDDVIDHIEKNKLYQTTDKVKRTAIEAGLDREVDSTAEGGGSSKEKASKTRKLNSLSRRKRKGRFKNNTQ